LQSNESKLRTTFLYYKGAELFPSEHKVNWVSTKACSIADDASEGDFSKRFGLKKSHNRTVRFMKKEN